MGHSEKKLELRFNGGAGALLCPTCRCIVAYGFEHVGKIYLCKNCQTEMVVSGKRGNLIALVED